MQKTKQGEPIIANFKGRCLCDQVQFEADQIAANYAHCHCSMCQKFHGAAFSTYGAAPKSAFRWLHGEHMIRAFVADNETTRQFCIGCGSSLTFATNKKPDTIEFALALLDDAPPLKPDAHLHTDSMVAWLDLSRDPLPKFTGDRES